MKRLLLPFLSLIMLMFATQLSYSQCNITIAEPDPLNVIISGTTTICSGNTTVITVKLEGGTQPWHISYPGLGLSSEEIYDTDGTDDSTFVHTFTTPVLTNSITFNSSNVVVTDVNSCTANYTGAAIVTVNPQAEIFAGADATICETGTYSLSDATSSNTSSLLWTTSGTGTFSDNTITNPIYTPSAADISVGTVTLTLTGKGLESCDNVSDVMTLTITPQATIFAGVDATICETGTYSLSDATSSNTSSLLWTTSGSGTFSDAAIINPIYTPSAADISAGSVVLTLTGTGLTSCSDATDNMTLNISIQPLAVNDINSTLQGVAVSGNVSTNDIPSPGDGNTWSVLTQPSDGTLVFSADGSYIYTPSPNFAGSDLFTYTLCDTNGACDCDTAWVNIAVIPATPVDTNQRPIALNDTYITHIGTTLSGNVLHNDYDPDGDALTVSTIPVVAPLHGTLTLNADGTFTYIPNTGFVGEDSFTYQVCDDGTPSLCTEAVVSIIVIDNASVNTTYAMDDMFVTDYDTPLSGNVLDNDYDLEGDAQTVATSPLSGVSHGTLIISSDGSFNYTPNAGYYGPDQFVYQVCDNGSPVACDSATVYIVVRSENYYPLAIDDINSTLEGTAVSGNVSTNDIPSADGGNVWSSLTQPTNGTLVFNADGSYTYTPNLGFVGSDLFSYSLCDIDGDCDTATVNIAVIPTTPVDTNQRPIALNDAYITNIGVTLSGNVLYNDYDPDGDALTVSTIPVVAPLHGTLTLNADGTFTYVPTPGFVGEDSFTYQVCDDGTPSLCAEAVVSIMVIDNAGVNTTYAMDDHFVTDFNTQILGNVLTNDYDLEGDIQTVTTVPLSGVSRGTLTLNSDGSFIYVPGAGCYGTDQFVYQVCDDGSPIACDSATVYIVVRSENYYPVAINDINSTLEGTAVSGDVSTNDVLSAGGGNVWSALTQPANGTLVFNADGSYTYTPSAGFTGSDLFTYTLCDIDGDCDTASVSIAVIPATPVDTNQRPIALNDTYITHIGTTLSGNVLHNDYDPDGDALTVSTIPVVSTSNGDLTLNADGTFTYVPNPGFVGEDSFTYQVCDDGSPSLCTEAVVTIMVVDNAGINTTYAVDDHFVTEYNTQLLGNVSTNDYDLEGDAQTVATLPLSGVSHGTLILNTDGSFIYTPNAGYFGPDQFVYRVFDDGSPVMACDSATVYIVVRSENYYPLAIDDINSTLEGTAVSGNVSTNDIPSADGGNVWSSLTQPSNGTLVFNADGSYTYTPSAGFTGSDLFTYTLCDIDGDCDTATVNIAVIPATPVDTNQRPIALNDTYITHIGTTLSGNVLHNDYDPDGDALTVSTIPVVSTSNGDLTLNADGTFTYIPNPGFVGEDSFTYQVCDDGTPSLCTEAVVSIIVIDNSSINTTYAMDDMFVTDYNTPLFGNVLDNDYDLEGDAQTVTTLPLSGVSHGTLTISSDGSFNYTPNAGYYGPDQFVYQVCDNGSPIACDSATVYLVVKVNEAPIVDDVEVSTPEDTPIEICLDITDVNSGSTFTASVCGDPVNGVISAPVVNNTTSQVCFTYTPNANFNGIDSLCIEVCDNGLPILCDQATVTIIVTPVNDPPVVFNEYEEICSNTVLVSTVFNGDYDVDSTDLFVGNVIKDGTYGNIIITDATIGTYSYTVNTTITATVVDTVVVEICDNGIPLPSLCTNDTIFITIVPEAVVYAGADATICETGVYTLSDATATYTSAVAWTTNGDGTFSDATALNPIYTPGADDIATGTVTLTLTGTALAPCDNVADSMILSITRQAIVDAGADATICETGVYTLSDATATYTSAVAWTTNGDGTFSDATALNPIYTPGASDILTGTVTLTLTGTALAPCDNVADSMILSITRQAIVNAGADATICETGAYTLSDATATYTSAVAWITDGDGTFDDATALNPVYTPGAGDIAAGTVTLTLTGTALAPCDNVADSMILSITRQAIVDAGADATICETGTHTLSDATATYTSAVAWITNGDGTFSDATALNPIYTPGAGDIAAGTVTLTLTGTALAPCDNVADSMILSITRQAIVDAGADATICETGTYTLSDATATYTSAVSWITSGDGTFDDATALNPIYTPGASDILTGTVTLTLIGTALAPCDNVADSMILSITRQAIVDAGADATICETGVYTLSDATATYTSAVAWITSGDGTFSDVTALNPIYTPGSGDITAGTVTLTITGTALAPCDNVADSMILSITRQAIVNAGADATICETGVYTLSDATATYTSTVAWTTNGDGTFSDATALNPIYTPGAGDIAAGTVTLTITGTALAPCDNVADSMILSITRQAIVNAGADATICETGVYTLSDATATYTSALAWITSGDGTFDDATALNPVYTPGSGDITAGTVTLTLTGTALAPCDNVADSMILSITRQAIVDAGADATICETGVYTLSDATATYTSAVAWITSGDGTFSDATALNPIYTPGAGDIAAGTVTLTLTGTALAPCDNVADSMILSITRQAIVDAGADATICETGVYTLSDATATYTSAVAWITSGDGTFDDATALNPIYTPGASDILAGTVTLTLTGTALAPCDNVADSMILSITRQAIVDAGADATICETGTYTLSDATATYTSAVAWITNGDGTFSDATALNPIYTPGASDILAGTVTLTLTGTALAPCDNVADSMILSITRQAIVDAGADATICETGVYTLSDATATYTSAVAWITNGDGTFDDATALNPIYTPGASDILAGTVTLTLTGTALAPCDNIADSMILSITRQAIVNAGADATICETGVYTLSDATATYTSALAWITSGDGTFDDATALNPVYTPGSGDITAGTVTLTLTGTALAPCDNVADSMILSITRQAIVDAGADATICETGAYTLSDATATYTSAVAWITSGDGTFSDVTALNPIYTPGSGDITAGTVTLTITGTALAPCDNVADSMILSITRQAIVDAGADATICETGVYTLSDATATYTSAVAWTTSGDGTFSDVTALNPIYTPGSGDITAGTVTLTITGTALAPCDNVADSMILSITRQAIVNAGADATICETGTYTLSDATATYTSAVAWITNGDGTFSDATALNPIYTPGASDILAGTVTLTLTGTALAPCDNVADSMILSITRQAIVDAGADATICETGVYTLSDATATYTSAVAWITNGDGTFDDATALNPIYTPGASDILAGTVTLTLTGTALAPCDNIADSMILSITRQAIVNAGADATICETGVYTLSDATATYTSALAWITSGDGTFDDATALNPVYTPGSGDITAGTVTLTLTGTALAPCDNVADSMILSITRQAIVDAGADATICETGAYTLSDATATYTSAVAWITSGDGTFSDVTALNPIYTPGSGDITAGTVTLTITGTALAPCDNVADSMILSITRQAIVDAGADATICETGVYTLSDATATYTSAVAWTTSGDGTFSDVTALNPIYTPGSGDITAGTVTLTITGTALAPCDNVADSMILSITRQAIVNAGADATICETGVYTLSDATATYTSALAWITSGDGTFDDATALNPVYTPGSGDITAGTVTLTLTGTALAPCDNVADSMILSITRQAIVDAGADATICETGTYTLSDATATYTSAVAWTTNGDGTFSDATALNPIYTPGASDILAGTVTLTLTGTALAPCDNVADSMILSITRQAIVDAGADATICETGAYTLSDATATYTSALAWITSGDGTFDDATALNPVYTPGAGDIAAGTVTLTLTGTALAPCDNVADSMILSITRQAIVDAGADATICETGTYTLSDATATYTSAVAWITSGDGTFDDATALNPIYTPGAGDIAAGTVTLTLTGTALAPCADASDEMILSITRQAIVNAGADDVICETSTYTLSGATESYTDALAWITSGDGTFDDATALNPVYTPGAGDIAAGTVTLTLTGTALSPCADASDAMILSITRQAIVNAGADDIICETGTYTLSGATESYTDALAWITSGDGTFDDATALNPVYTPGAGDIAAGTVTLTLTGTALAPCADASDEMILSITRQAIVDAGADDTMCEVDTYTLSGATASHTSALAWTTSGDGTFSDATALNPIYTPGAGDKTAGTVTLTLTGTALSPCADVTDAMILTITPQVAVDAGADGTICEGDTYTLSGSSAVNFAAITWTTSGDGSFDNDTILHPVYTPGINDMVMGTVTLTLTGTGLAPCSDAVDSMTLGISPIATVNAGPDDAICEGDTYALSGSSAVHYLSLAWSTSGDGVFSNATILHPVYIPGSGDIASGSVVLTLNAVGVAPCPNATDYMTLTINSNPVAFAGDDATICGGDAYTLSGSSATNYLAITWTTSGDGSFDDANALNPVYTPGSGDIASGSVILTLTATGIGSCSDATDDMTLSIVPQPVVNAGSDAQLCNNTSYTVYNASVEGASQFVWTHDGDGILTNENTLTPTYIPASTEFGVVTLTLTATGEEPCGTVSDQMQIVISPAAYAYAGDDLISCQDVNGIIEEILITGAVAKNHTTIEWITEGTGTFDDASLINPTYTPSIADIESGMVTLIINVHAVTPCENVADTMSITFSKAPTAFAGADASICQGSHYVVVDATASNYSTVTWSLQPVEAGILVDGNTLEPTFVGDATFSGTVTLTMVVHGGGACSGRVATSTMQITVIPGITVNAGEDQFVNMGAITTLNGTVSGGSGLYSLSWTPSELLDDNTIYNPTTTPIFANTTYTLTALDLQTGCMGSDEVTIYIDSINRPPIAVDDYDTTFVNNPITINVLNNDSDPDGDIITVVSICADPLHGTVVINPDNTITYTPNKDYIGNDQFCYTICDDGIPTLCSSAIVYITMDNLIIFNLLTSDGDGINDVVHIEGIEAFPDNKVIFFNRWGDKVREFENYDNVNVVWDGTNENNRPLPDGTYFCIVDLKANGKITGWIYVKNGKN